ncbi:MAG: ribosomal protein S18-alanine N-acetyltransferase, partial [Lachnospiraceae bacterium]|nr:ribosomal protein S18-alanine N-acetyltransferase [Lachnospiraceae bacterium]
LDSEYDEAWVLQCADGTIAGYMNARFLCGEGELMRIVVRPDLRGLGYSRKFMEQLEKTARAKEIEALTLEVRRGNTPAISLYKSWGFKEEAVRKRYYRDPTEDAILMWNRQLLGITT